MTDAFALTLAHMILLRMINYLTITQTLSPHLITFSTERIWMKNANALINRVNRRLLAYLIYVLRSMTFLPIAKAYVGCRSASSPNTTWASSSYISRMVWPRIAKFYIDIHIDLVYSPTGYDVTCYFWSAVITKTVENAASDGFR